MVCLLSWLMGELYSDRVYLDLHVLNTAMIYLGDGLDPDTYSRVRGIRRNINQRKNEYRQTTKCSDDYEWKKT